jgi:outer membrane protein
MIFAFLPRRGRSALLGALLFAVAGDAAAQQAPATLTLDEAIRLARRYNPAYLITANDEGDAAWQQREAFAAFLPSVSLNGSAQYVAEGTPNLGFLTGADVGVGKIPSSYYSNYGLNAAISISGATLFEAARASAARRATEAGVDAAGYTLATDVSRQYLAALRAQDGVTLAERDFESARRSHELATARFDLGAVTRLDVATAEVERGRAEVAVLQAQQQAETSKLRLMQQIGVQAPADIQLTSSFEVFEPRWSLDALTERALSNHPQIVAARASERAGTASARAATMQYLPSLRISAGVSGYSRQVGDDAAVLSSARKSIENRQANCEFGNRISDLLGDAPEDCSGLVFNDELAADVLAANDVFPFNFTSNPANVTLSLSFPIFDGFTRERQLQQARSAADDARQRRRAEELNRRTQVAEAYVALLTAYRTVAIEERNAAAAAETLELARERYRLGVNSIIELTQTQATKARADRDHLNALYTFHENFAALEAAVGEPLRAR